MGEKYASLMFLHCLICRCFRHKAAQKGVQHLCEVALGAVDNLEYMFEARFESLNLMNRRLKDDLGQKSTILDGSYSLHRIRFKQMELCSLLIHITDHIRNLKHLQDQNSASMDEMEKDYLEQLQSVEDENEKLKLSISEGNDLLSRCQKALALASQKSATLTVTIHVQSFRSRM